MCCMLILVLVLWCLDQFWGECLFKWFVEVYGSTTCLHNLTDGPGQKSCPLQKWLADATICSPLCENGIGSCDWEEEEEKKWVESFLIFPLTFSTGSRSGAGGSGSDRVQPLCSYHCCGFCCIPSVNTDVTGVPFLCGVFIDVIMWQVSQRVSFRASCFTARDIKSPYYYMFPSSAAFVWPCFDHSSFMFLTADTGLDDEETGPRGILWFKLVLTGDKEAFFPSVGRCFSVYVFEVWCNNHVYFCNTG